MLKLIRFSTIFTLLLGTFATPNSEAQVYREQFGKNRIQYKYFNWEYYESNNFEVYFYDGGKDLAQKTINYLEEEISRVRETLGYFPYSKTRVFLYNSIADKQQSNVGVRGQNFTLGGQTNFIKSQVEVAYSGDYASFNKKLIYNVSEMLVDEMLFGGNITEMFQSAFSSPIPVWFSEGIAAYVAYGWNKEMDDAAREYVSHDSNPAQFSKLNHETNVLLGQSIWNFIAQTYGQRSVSNILNLARIVRDEESSIYKTLGIPYNQFLKEWRDFYSSMNTSILESYTPLSDEKIVSSKRKKTEKITDVKFNPQGSLLAYSVLDKGKYEVRVINMESKEEMVIQKGGRRLLNQEVNDNYPLISWVDETTLGIVTNKEGRNIVTIKRVGTKGEQELAIPTLTQIQSFEFKEGGRLAVMTGVVGGVSDAYLFLVNRGTIRRITNDTYDDRDISLFPESNIVMFASNRPSDSVYVKGPEKLEKVNLNQFNIYGYDLDLVDSVFSKYTNSLSVESKPNARSLNEIYYLTDQQGINNLYRYTLNDSISTQLSSFSLGIKDFSIDVTHNRIALISIENSRDVVYVVGINELNRVFTPVTPRRAQETTRILAQLRRQRLLAGSEVEKEDTLKAKTLNNVQLPAQPKLDSLKEGAIDTENYIFNTESKVDSKNYRFETPTANKEPSQRSFLSIYQNRAGENRVKGPISYEPRFQTDNVVTTFVIDELRSFSQLLEVQMNDYLENHRLYGGLLVPYNFNSGFDAFMEYEYLKEKIDLSAKYYRKSIYLNAARQGAESQRYNLNRFEVGATYPFSPNLHLEVSPFFAQTRYIEQDFSQLINPTANVVTERTANYMGINTSLVYDNSMVNGTNIHNGTRAKITYEGHYKINNEANSFNNLEVDVRQYQRVVTGVYLAGRFFFGHYAGSAPKRYLLGGVDNWAFNKKESTGEDGDPFLLRSLNDNSDILFNQFTNLRGYNYNTFKGNSVMTFSAELRLPVSQLISNSNTKSNFLKNLQFVGFYDIGSAWDDISPFVRQNNQNTEIVDEDGSPFSAVINNFSNPWLQSTGVGMRTMLFGFFSRLDLSWPIRDFIFQSPKFQISVGYDF